MTKKKSVLQKSVAKKAHKKRTAKSDPLVVEPKIKYGIYTSAIEGIKHFDTVQTALRVFTSTLLLGIFAVLGFLFSSTGLELTERGRLVVTSCIALAGLLPITCICLIDLIFQERLLISNFLTAERCEAHNSLLPKIHSSMFIDGKHHGEPLKKVWFYIGCGWSLILVGSFSLSAIFFDFPNNELDMSLVGFVGLIVSAIYCMILKGLTGRYSIWKKRI